MKDLVLCSYGVLIYLSIVKVFHLKSKLLASQYGLFVIIFNLSEFVPVFKGCTIAEILLGQLGQLSISTMIILWLTLLTQKSLSRRIDSILNFPAQFIICILGIILYLGYFGFLELDIYHYGYFLDNPWAIGAFFMLQLYLWQYARRFSYIWLIALFAFVARLQASNNLWDYLFDAVLWFACVVSLLKTLLHRTKRLSG